MIIQTNIPFYSLCEHHTAPFFGTGTIAYIPNGKIVGLSKLARTLDFYANRFQNQERITSQVAERLWNELNPKGVAVSLTAQHLCMSMRGVKKHDTWTTTNKLLGVFKEVDNARMEFLSHIK
jgi:GTP cyclohydrolase I